MCAVCFSNINTFNPPTGNCHYLSWGGGRAGRLSGLFKVTFTSQWWSRGLDSAAWSQSPSSCWLLSARVGEVHRTEPEVMGRLRQRGGTLNFWPRFKSKCHLVKDETLGKLLNCFESQFSQRWNVDNNICGTGQSSKLNKVTYTELLFSAGVLVTCFYFNLYVPQSASPILWDRQVETRKRKEYN